MKHLKRNEYKIVQGKAKLKKLTSPFSIYVGPTRKLADTTTVVAYLHRLLMNKIFSYARI